MQIWLVLYWKFLGGIQERHLSLLWIDALK
jgi:hypothetical protein